MIDIVRLSPQNPDTCHVLQQLSANTQDLAPFTLKKQQECNGYWQNVTGMALISSINELLLNQPAKVSWFN